MQLIAVAIGGALGAVGRYWVGLKTYDLLGGSYPYATIFVNVLGSLLMGFVMAGLMERLPLEWRGFIVVGFLGSFTTFSTFSADTIRLVEAGNMAAAVGYVALSLVLGLTALVGGLYLGKGVF